MGQRFGPPPEFCFFLRRLLLLLFYDDLRPGTVLLFDDISLSDDMQEILKSATANFREPIVHRTVSRERQLKVCTIPERCVWWLAKVESIGDDQVMNRMLTVWIDDTTTQDLAVLEHLKEIESGPGCCGAEDPDVYVCRAIWEILKGAIHQVRIPFARRINFSVTQNRRNPAMLFDLIKCHALLHIFQRDVDDNGSLIATHDDFCYARSLYLAINGKGGGQETKLTKNEAAALASIAKMNLEVFTIHQLQDALGFSYQPTYRLLHGYTSKKAVYTGILDKCPAVSLIDATVAEMLGEMEIKRREKYFSFDMAIYREWMRESDVWLEPDDTEGNSDDDNSNDGDDVFISSSRFRTEKAENENIKGGDTDVHSPKEDSSIDICTDSTGCFHTNPVSFDTPVSPMATGVCLSDAGVDVNEPDKMVDNSLIPEQTTHHPLFVCKSNCNEMKTGENMKSGRAGTTLPLPGILDHRDFERFSVSLGHCTLCGDGRAVYQSKAQRAAICEKCYARLVREANKEEGVR